MICTKLSTRTSSLFLYVSSLRRNAGKVYSSLLKRVIAWDPNCLAGQVEQPPWIMTRHFVASCCVFCAPITSGTSRSSRTYLYTNCVFFLVVLAPRQRSHLWSCFTVHSPGFSRDKIVPGTFFPFSFIFSCSFFFQFHLPFCYIELL